jgi:hypothetical protein
MVLPDLTSVLEMEFHLQQLRWSDFPERLLQKHAKIFKNPFPDHSFSQKNLPIASTEYGIRSPAALQKLANTMIYTSKS